MDGTAAAPEFDVAIIGAGPVGLFAAFQCRMLRLRCVLIDALAEIGGQCVALYPEKPIYDIPAHPAIEAGALIAALEAQLAPFDVPRLLGRRVTGLAGAAGGFALRTDRGEKVAARTVLIAAGAGAFGPNRPPLQGIEQFEASGAVQYFVRSRESLRGCRVAIAGGGDSAVDWALSLADVAERIWLIHRRDRFRAAPESIARLGQAVAAGRVEIVVPYQLQALEGEAGQLGGVSVATLDGAHRTLPADRLLAFFGLSTDLGPIASWGIETGLHGVIPVTAATLQTSLPGVFAIGDVATYPGKLKLILQGFSEAAMAAHAIHRVARPDTVLRFEHSTTHGLPVS